MRTTNTKIHPINRKKYIYFATNNKNNEIQQRI